MGLRFDSYDPIFVIVGMAIDNTAYLFFNGCGLHSSTQRCEKVEIAAPISLQTSQYIWRKPSIILQHVSVLKETKETLT